MIISQKSALYTLFTILSIVFICVSVYFLYNKTKKEDNFKITKNLKERFKFADEGTISTYEDLLKVENKYKSDLKTDQDQYNSSKSITDTKVSKLTSDYSSINTLMSKIIKSQDSLTNDVRTFDAMITNSSSTPTDLASKSVELQDKAKIIFDDVNNASAQINVLKLFANESKNASDDTLIKANAYLTTVSEGSKIISAFNSLQQYKDTDSSVKGASNIIQEAQKALDDKKVINDDIPMIQHGIEKVSLTITKISDILENITRKLEVGKDIKDLAAKQVDNINIIISDINEKVKILNDFSIQARDNLSLINGRILDLQLSTDIFNSNVMIDKNYVDLNNFYTNL